MTEHPNPYVEQATQWFKSAPQIDMFGGGSNVVIYAVAEYIANQNSNSIYCNHPEHNHKWPCHYLDMPCSPRCFCCMGELARDN